VQIDTRFVAGTNRNLRDMVNRGEFRQDLYYRLNIVRVVVPPLRDRCEDIPVLLDHFNALYAKHYKHKVVAISTAVRSVLTGYAWPGNVRELAAWVERLYVTGLGPEVLLEMLLGDGDGASAPSSLDGLTLQQAERRAIVHAMEQANFNQRKAARMLQVHRATLSRKLRKHRLA
jgi:two-component system, NtrC family, response regulator HydG